MTPTDPSPAFMPEIMLLYCQGVLSPGQQPKQGWRQGEGFKAKFVLLPCSSKAEPQHLLSILAKGPDAVLLVACEPERCKFLNGSRRSTKRIEYAQGLLTSAGVAAERLGLSRGRDMNLDDLMAVAGQRARAVAGLGPNPVKGEARP